MAVKTAASCGQRDCSHDYKHSNWCACWPGWTKDLGNQDHGGGTSVAGWLEQVETAQWHGDTLHHETGRGDGGADGTFNILQYTELLDSIPAILTEPDGRATPEGSRIRSLKWTHNVTCDFSDVLLPRASAQ